MLEGKRVEPAAIEHAVAALTASGFLDDVRFAALFAEDKRSLQSWGADRIGRELRRRGIAPELVERTLAARGRADELGAAVELLGERFGTVGEDDRERDRAWRMLVRKGYEPEVAYEAVRAAARSQAA